MSLNRDGRTAEAQLPSTSNPFPNYPTSFPRSSSFVQHPSPRGSISSLGLHHDLPRFHLMPPMPAYGPFQPSGGPSPIHQTRSAETLPQLRSSPSGPSTHYIRTITTSWNVTVTSNSAPNPRSQALPSNNAPKPGDLIYQTNPTSRPHSIDDNTLTGSRPSSFGFDIPTPLQSSNITSVHADAAARVGVYDILSITVETAQDLEAKLDRTNGFKHEPEKLKALRSGFSTVPTLLLELQQWLNIPSIFDHQRLTESMNHILQKITYLQSAVYNVNTSLRTPTERSLEANSHRTYLQTNEENLWGALRAIRNKIAECKENLGHGFVAARPRSTDPPLIRSRTPLVTPPTESAEAFCLHDGGELEAINATKAKRAEKWLSDLYKWRDATWTALQTDNHASAMDSIPPVKIAIIDTGAAFDNRDLDAFDYRLIERRSWVDGRAGQVTSGIDTVGHGTHATSLLLKVTQNTDCEVYVARCFKNDPQENDGAVLESDSVAQGVADAIKFAVEVWKVDILSLSFGSDRCTDSMDNMKTMITQYAPTTLFFAATSNSGGNKAPTWPARHPHVIPVFASDGKGNAYDGNPNPIQYRYNISTLGVAVQGSWPPGLESGCRSKCKTGTSCATPISAGVAACVLSLIRTHALAELPSLPAWDRPDAIEAAKRLMSRLKEPHSMIQVFWQIGADNQPRQDYQCVVPWNIFQPSPDVAVRRIKELVDRL